MSDSLSTVLTSGLFPSWSRKSVQGVICFWLFDCIMMVSRRFGAETALLDFCYWKGIEKDSWVTLQLSPCCPDLQQSPPASKTCRRIHCWTIRVLNNDVKKIYIRSRGRGVIFPKKNQVKVVNLWEKKGIIYGKWRCGVMRLVQILQSEKKFFLVNLWL